MIGGFPHRPEDSFFHLTMERLRKESTHPIVSSLFTMGGFPVTRVLKHLKARCLSTNPDIVVIQFASSDLIVPLRRKCNLKSGGISSTPRTVANNPPSLANLLNWQIQGLIGDGLRLQSVTPQEVFLETIQQIAQKLLDHQIIPVVMSPFAFGGRRSDRLARICAGRLQQTLPSLPQAIYVDAYSALARHPRRKMLLADGVHLSLAGHRVVAEVLFPKIKTLVDSAASMTRPQNVGALVTARRECPAPKNVGALVTARRQ